MSRVRTCAVQDIARLQCGSFLTEFDADDLKQGELVSFAICYSHDRKCELCVQQTLNKADETLTSWAEWQFKAFVPITVRKQPMPDQSLLVRVLQGEGHGVYDAKTGQLIVERLKLFSRCACLFVRIAIAQSSSLG